ncbi:MAG: hypothetical protein SVS85_04460 [Candidatus Nanohaloarchaea archaeon]|nr:hypothetical protein [Candidatus Nanohaloarchaea archaeon]
MSTSPLSNGSRSSSRGQSSLEFIIMLSLVMLIFSAFVSVFVNKRVSAVEKERKLVATTVADKVGFELDRALVEGEGYSRRIELRGDIRGEEYNITVGNGTVIVSYGINSVRGYTAVDSISGSLEPGLNEIRNTGGGLVVTQP